MGQIPIIILVISHNHCSSDQHKSFFLWRWPNLKLMSCVSSVKHNILFLSVMFGQCLLRCLCWIHVKTGSCLDTISANNRQTVFDRLFFNSFLTLRALNFNFLSFEVMPRYRYTQLQMDKITNVTYNLKQSIISV